MKAKFVFFILLFPLLGFAQPQLLQEKVIPNAIGRAIFQNNQGGYDFITGYAGGSGGICKLNVSFDSIFFRPSILANSAESILPAVDSGYLTSGISHAQVGFRAGVGKLTPSGFVLWQNYSLHEGFMSYGRGSVVTPDSGLIVVGVADSGGTKRKALLMKVDGSGQVEWDRTYGEVHHGYNPVYLSHGILSLWTDMQGAHILKKHTHSGDQVWSVSVPAQTDGILVGLYALSANRFVVLNSARVPNIGGRLQAVCVDSLGNTIWNQIYSDLPIGLYFQSFRPKKAVVTPSNELLVFGELVWSDDTFNISSRRTQLLLKIDTNGDVAWEQSYGLDQLSLEGMDIRVLPDGRILALSSGASSSNGQYYSVLAEFGPDSTTSIRNSPGTLALNVQPQPARDLLEIALSAESAAKAAFTLTDLQGRTLIRRTEVLTPGENRIILPVSQLAVGIYLLRAESEGKIGVKKVVVE